MVISPILALYPLIEDAAPLEAILETYKTDFEAKHLQMMKAKLGLYETVDNDADFIKDLEENLQFVETDMTLFFRNLSDFKDEATGFDVLKDAFYDFDNMPNAVKEKWKMWFLNYEARLQHEYGITTERKEKMNTVNPKYVLRNYMAQLAIDAADEGNYNLIDELFKMLKKPYDEQPQYEKWLAKRPEWARHKVGCSMLSCSS